MTKPKHQDNDIILIVIVIISILITTLLDAIQCLISLTSSASTPSLIKQGLPSNATIPTLSGKVKTQRLSPSTKRRSTTAVQKKVDGTTTEATLASPIASSPRSKQSKSISPTQMSTKSGTNQTSGSPRRTRSTKSATPTTTPSPTLNPNLTTADQINDINRDQASGWVDTQPTEHLHVLPESQEEVQEHTVLRTKMSRSKLKG